MSQLATETATEVRRLLQFAGSPLTFVSVARGGYDAAAGVYAPETLTNVTVYGVDITVTKTATTDERSLLLPAEAAVKAGDRVLMAGLRWDVLSLTPYILQGEAVATECRLRRGG